MARKATQSASDRRRREGSCEKGDRVGDVGENGLMKKMDEEGEEGEYVMVGTGDGGDWRCENMATRFDQHAGHTRAELCLRKKSRDGRAPLCIF